MKTCATLQVVCPNAAVLSVVVTPAIFLPGPARPSTAPARMLSRVAHCEMLRADSSVCGSSITTRDGRTVRPSARLYFMPRIRPVMPATLIMAPLASE